MLNDLNEAAAILADAAIIVRARFVEAADTMAHVQVRNLRPDVTRSLWPAMTPEQVDGDYRSRYRPSNASISRAEEVMQGWLLDFVPEEEHRMVAVRWSMCLATPKWSGSFGSFCKKTGRVRRTAERRVERTFQSVASALLNNARSLHEPDWGRVSQLLPKSDTHFGMVAERVAERQTHWRADDAKPSDLPEYRDTGWAQDQNRRRRVRAERDAA